MIEVLGSWSGTIFQLASAGTPSAVSRSTVKLPPGHFSSLKILATGVNGNHPGQAFTVTYADGSTSIVRQSLSDWRTPQSYVGEQIASSMAYRVDSSGNSHTGPYNLYGYALPIDASKTVMAVALPATVNVVVLAMTLVP